MLGGQLRNIIIHRKPYEFTCSIGHSIIEFTWFVVYKMVKDLMQGKNVWKKVAGINLKDCIS